MMVDQRSELILQLVLLLDGDVADFGPLALEILQDLEVFILVLPECIVLQAGHEFLLLCEVFPFV